MKGIPKRYLLVAGFAIAFACLLVQYFRLSGLFDRRVPVLETRPNNCYDRTIRVLARPFYNPYTFFDSEGNLTGHDVELINIIANELKMNLDLQLTDWNSAIEAIKNGKADVLMACEFFNRHSSETELANTVYTVYDEFAVFGKKPLDKPIQLLDKKIGILKNGNVSSNLYSMGLAGKCTGYDSYFGAFKALMNGECEYVIGRTAVGIAILEKLGAKDIKPLMSIGSSCMCFGLSPDNKELRAKIDAILMKFKTDGTLERLHRKWLTTFVQPYTFSDVIRNNPWLPLTALALVALLVYVYVRWHREKRAQMLEIERMEGNLDKLSQKANDYHAMLIKASSGYLEVNLSQNAIIGDIIDVDDDGTQTVIDLSNIGNPIGYNEFIKWWADNMLVSDKDEFLAVSNCEYFISKFNAGQKIVDVFCTSMRKNRKSERHSKQTYYIFRNETNGNIMAFCLVTDITDEVNAERKANELRQVLSAMANDYDSILHFDFDKHRVDCYRFGRLLKDAKEVDGKVSTFEDFMKGYAEDFILPEDRKDFISEMTVGKILPVIKSGKVFSAKFRYGSQEAPRWLGISMIHHKEHHDKNCAIIGIRDMTDEISTEQRHQAELREQNRALEKARDMAQAASNAKTAFLFNMSHDIRTPMGAILGFTDLAIKNIDDKAKTLDCLKKTKVSGEHLLSLINDILEMSRIESGKVTLEEKDIDLINVCESSLPMLHILAEEKNISFSFNSSDITERKVHADSLRLSQIIINVISNAMKYTEAGGKVSFTLSQESCSTSGKNMYCLVFEDTGIGMSKEFQRHIFETFSRENTSTVSGRQGTGLGMAITKNLVELMGGTIEVESEQGMGSKFTIRIPLRPVSANDSASDNATDDTKSHSSLEGKKVLLVDDNDLNREIASELLMENGLEVDMAEDGSIAVEMIRERGCRYYDFVLMDIQMPIMDGYKATSAIRALHDSDSLPIIALSANAFEEDRQKSLNAGMNAHIAKPIKVKELLDTLRRFA